MFEGISIKDMFVIGATILEYGFFLLLGILLFIKKIRAKAGKDTSVVDSVLCNMEEVQSLMEKAELLTGVTGPVKKELVKTWYAQFCINSGLHYDEGATEKAIEELIGFTKSVNARAKDKEQTPSNN
jgi:hypothetical protein